MYVHSGPRVTSPHPLPASTWLRSHLLTPLSHGALHPAGARQQVPAYFLLDPGSSHTLLEPSKISTFGCPLQASTHQGAGVEGSVVGTALSLGNELVFHEQLVFGNQPAYVLSLEHVNTAFRQCQLQEIDGVIGADLLGQGAAVIDYATYTLYLDPNR